MSLFSPGKSNAPTPPHPYRDSVLVYGGMCVLLVAAAVLTGGKLVKALIAAAIFFVLSTAWSWWGYRRRIRARGVALPEEAAATSSVRGGGENGSSNGSDGSNGSGRAAGGRGRGRGRRAMGRRARHDR